MTTSQMRQYSMFVRVREFGDTHANLFPESSYAAKAFADVRAVVDDLNQHAVSKMSASRGAGRSTTAARVALLRRLREIRRTAAVIRTETTGLEGKFYVPQSKGTSSLLTSASVFACDAKMLAPHFIARAMPSTFVGDLRDLAATLESAVKTRDEERGDRAVVRVLITQACARGMAAVRALDAMVINHLPDESLDRATWRAIRRIDYSRAGSRRRPGSEASGVITPS